MSEELDIIYEGKEPYLFVSYSHQDQNLVEPIIQGLYDMGYRLWYDTGIAVGSRWPDTIADHVIDSSCVVAFISRNAIASTYCQEELFFALEEGKPVVAVYLEDIKLSSGLRMRLSAKQAIYRYRFDNDASFITKLDKENVIRPSKKTPSPFSQQKKKGSGKSAMLPEILLENYRKLDPKGPGRSFISAGTQAIKLKQFSYEQISTALGDRSAATQAINRMMDLKIIHAVGENAYETLISPADWTAFVALSTQGKKA